MGLPMVQVFMIMARQMSKPVADVVMRYGKSHPFFRDKILVPVGRGLVNLTTRLRMRSLGLGKPDALAPVSETAALEQASELVQQTVIFGYSVGVFAAYHFYSKANEKEVVSAEDYRNLLNQLDEKFLLIDRRLESIQNDLDAQKEGVVGVVKKSLFSSKSTPAAPEPSAVSKPLVIHSSIPFDEALEKKSSGKKTTQTQEDLSD
ncbi:unnamed protein product [Bursaphelenchus xylophilus]|uniref:(pine wood nematode) hypothetical protein n=1 Tax=Bursaphelenchus xylophilus TaxID=6326 RepID=A0A1I7RNC0_BURXY|nr:unnamed protein product [Bursaphelenchus xylophilus]CAG9123858.1 unnamed protein product [Bursaphelenchus xylophilus]